MHFTDTYFQVFTHIPSSILLFHFWRLRQEVRVCVFCEWSRLPLCSWLADRQPLMQAAITSCSHWSAACTTAPHSWKIIPIISTFKIYIITNACWRLISPISMPSQAIWSGVKIISYGFWCCILLHGISCSSPIITFRHWTLNCTLVVQLTIGQGNYNV